MAAGVPLDDDDRTPWLRAIRSAIEACTARGGKAVVACSSLKNSYRTLLAPDPAEARFTYLRGNSALFAGRLRERSGHFMREGLLPSQFEVLEEPLEALALDAGLAPGVLVDRILEVLALP